MLYFAKIVGVSAITPRYYYKQLHYPHLFIESKAVKLLVQIQKRSTYLFSFSDL